MLKIYYILLISLCLISCQQKTEFQKLYDSGSFAEAFFISLDAKTVSSNSFKKDELIRITLKSHLPQDNNDLSSIRKNNNMNITEEIISDKKVELMQGDFSSFISSGREECYYSMDKQYSDSDKNETHGMCDQMIDSLDVFLGGSQLKIFGVHTIVDGQLFADHNDTKDKYSKYFSIHMLIEAPDQKKIDDLTKTFFQEKTLNEVRVVGKNILQCNLKITSTSLPDSSQCDEVEKLLRSVSN